MKLLKNIGVGFLVSFVGSLPMGYLNIVGYHIQDERGDAGVIYYLFGVIFIEAFVIYFTLLFAEKLAKMKKLIKYIELFSIFFMLMLAAIFFFSGNTDSAGDTPDYPDYAPFIIGLALNCVNFIQIPFWLGWNLYLLNSHFISAKKNLSYFYLAGALAGTFLGMFLFIKFLSLVINKSGGFSQYILSFVIPTAFVGLAIFQTYQFVRKYKLAR